MQRKLIAAALVAGVAALVLYLLRPTDEPEVRQPERDADVDARPRDRDRDRARRDRDDLRANDPERRARQEERARERFVAATTITPRTDAPIALTHDTLRAANDAGQIRFHQCVMAAGGYDAMRSAYHQARVAEDPEAEGLVRRPREQRTTPSTFTPSTSATSPAEAAAAEERPSRRVGRSASFDVGPDGRVDPNSIALSPDIGGPFAQCFRNHVAGLTLGEVGGGGAHVDMPLPGPRQPFPTANRGDGGV